MSVLGEEKPSAEHTAARPAISISDLSVHLAGRDLLKKLSVDVQVGEWVVLLGSNGAGKSTLLRCFVDLLPYTAKRLQVFGKDLSSTSPRERAKMLAYMPQGLASFAMSSSEFVALSRYPHQSMWGGLRAHDDLIVQEALRLSKASGLSAQALATLSGGERQRVLLAGALAQEAPILLLDEPGASLDPQQSEALWKNLQELRSKKALTLLQVSHDLEGSLRYADRVLGLAEGVLTLDSPANAVQTPELLPLYQSANKQPPLASQTKKSRASFVRVLAVLSFFLLLSLMLLPFVGALSIHPIAALKGDLAEPLQRVLFELRFPRVLAAAFAGGLLALAGTLLQALFRNPLATPYTLGISSGASFGAVLWMTLAPSVSLPFLHSGGQVGFAILGALLAMTFVWRLGKGAAMQDTRLLLAGVAINFSFAGMILLLQALSNPTQGMQILRWLMGGLDALSAPVLLLYGLLLLSSGAFFMLRASLLDLLGAGYEVAAGRGLNPLAARRGIFFLTSLLVALISAWCGPIAFVGMMAPHMARHLVGHAHRRALPVSLLLGSILLMNADALARWMIAPFELPVGVLTALLGGPFFLIVLRRQT
jgi:iron complex transport system permease protein